MSQSLAWEPIQDLIPKTLSDNLKRILSKKYNLQHGAQTLTERDITYLEGLRDAEVKDADKLISLINEHKKISIYLY